MKYSEAIKEILTQTDESFIGVSEERARQHFRGAISDLLKEGNYRNEEVHNLLSLKEYVFDGTENGMILLSDITSDNILKIHMIFSHPEDVTGFIISEASLDEVSRYSYANELKPSGKGIKFWQVGKKILFIPKSNLDGLIVEFVLVLSPPVWSEDPGAGEWGDDTDMLTEMSYGFLWRAINLAADNFRSKEVQI